MAAFNNNKSLDDVRKRWNSLIGGRYSSLTSLKSAVINGSFACDDTLRSLCWKLFLLLPDIQQDTWGDTIEKERDNYAELKRRFLSLHLKRSQETNGETGEEDFEDLNVVNPLSEDDSNPWTTYWKDEEMRKEILQDIERIFPDIDYFREEDIQRKLLDILFIYCKENPDAKYLQGMHEILAPIFWVISMDSVDEENIQIPGEQDLQLLRVLSSKFVEHDSYTLFKFIMSRAWEWYAPPIKKKQENPGARLFPPIVLKARRIQEKLLRNIDPELERHLRVLGIEPQLWGMRWIRLLFGREFDFPKVLTLWDCLFAADNTLELVDFICVAMLLRIRDQLLVSDYTGVMTLLLRYPVDDSMSLPSFVEDALYLQVHITPNGGRRIIQQYMIIDDHDLDQPMRMINGVLVPSTKNLMQQRRALVEKTVQGLAKNVFDTSERWSGGVNRYVRERVQDAKLIAANYATPETIAQSYRRMPTRHTGQTSIPILSPSSEDSEYLRERNERLAEVLETVITAFSQLEDSQQKKYKVAFDRMNYIKNCLNFDNIRIEDKYLTPIDTLNLPEEASLTENASNNTPNLDILGPLGSKSGTPVMIPNIDMTESDLQDSLHTELSSSSSTHSASSDNETGPKATSFQKSKSAPTNEMLMSIEEAKVLLGI
ncbi:rab-GTPase-TBC domain-containing protein [Dipodascopsis uninucleata]